MLVGGRAHWGFPQEHLTSSALHEALLVVSFWDATLRLTLLYLPLQGAIQALWRTMPQGCDAGQGGMPSPRRSLYRAENSRRQGKVRRGENGAWLGRQKGASGPRREAPGTARARALHQRYRPCPLTPDPNAAKCVLFFCDSIPKQARYLGPLMGGTPRVGSAEMEFS